MRSASFKSCLLAVYVRRPHYRGPARPDLSSGVSGEVRDQGIRVKGVEGYGGGRRFLLQRSTALVACSDWHQVIYGLYVENIMTSRKSTSSLCRPCSPSAAGAGWVSLDAPPPRYANARVLIFLLRNIFFHFTSIPCFNLVGRVARAILLYVKR